MHTDLKNIESRIKDINTKLNDRALIVSGHRYFFGKQGVEFLYFEFISKMMKVISINEVYSVIVSTLKDDKIDSLIDLSYIHFSHRKMQSESERYDYYSRLRDSGKRIRDFVHHEYIVPRGKEIQGLESLYSIESSKCVSDMNRQLSHLDDYLGSIEHDLEMFKINFNNWYQVFIQGVLQKSKYFQTKEMSNLSQKIWDNYIDYISFRKSEEFNLTAEEIRALLNEKSILIQNQEKIKARKEIEESKEKLKQVKLYFALCILFWPTMIMFFSNSGILTICVLFSLITTGHCWSDLNSIKADIEKLSRKLDNN